MIGTWKGKTNNVVQLMREGANVDLQDKVCCLFLHLMLCMRPHYLGVQID